MFNVSLGLIVPFRPRKGRKSRPVLGAPDVHIRRQIVGTVGRFIAALLDIDDPRCLPDVDLQAECAAQRRASESWIWSRSMSGLNRADLDDRANEDGQRARAGGRRRRLGRLLRARPTKNLLVSGPNLSVTLVARYAPTASPHLPALGSKGPASSWTSMAPALRWDSRGSAQIVLSENLTVGSTSEFVLVDEPTQPVMPTNLAVVPMHRPE